MTTLNVRPSPSSTSARVKKSPKESVLGVPFSYVPSADGTDENLLILFHGLGDTHVPFAKLGRSLKLPQTATLALRAPELIPYLYEQAYQWYPSFDQLGEVVQRPNPTSALDWMLCVLDHLIDDCGWPIECIHLFGFAQGGSVAIELGLKWWQRHRSRSAHSSDSDLTPRALGSIVTVCGPLLSFPTIAAEQRCPTPTLVFWRMGVSDSGEMGAGDVAAMEKGYASVREVKVAGGSGMLRSRDEWMPIMRFWSEKLKRRELTEGLLEVVR